MENQTFDLRNVRRYLDFPLKIETIGYRPKNNWVHRRNWITQYYLCFVLKSEKPVTIMRVNGSLQKNDLSLPRMGLVRPGTLLDSVEPSCKDELFFTYSAESGEQIDNFHLQKNCVFELTPAFNDTLQRIRNSFSELQSPGVADRLDCLAIELAQEAMIASLSLGKKPASQIIPDERIFLISNYFQIHFGDDIDLDSLLRTHGMSRRTFYRQWNRTFHVSPAQYILKQIMERSEYLLMHTDMSVRDIARSMGFSDDKYFMTAFRKYYGLPPAQYKRHGSVREQVK